MAVEKTKTFDLYTFFPYKSGKCGEVRDIIIIDKWLLEQNGSFERNTNLFPPKIPEDFMGCPISVSVIGFEPFVIVISSDKTQDGNIVYDVAGAYVEYFLITVEKMNLSVKFLPPKTDPSPGAFIDLLTDQIDGLSDIIIGFVPVFPIIAIPGLSYTVPHSCILFSLFVPCPTRIRRMSKLFSIFTFPVWLTLALAFVLTSATFWCLENKSRRSKSSEPCTATSMSLPVYNAWAILMAVSVPKMPKTWTHRILFLLYVCFSFAMVTVFQTSFVSYLVEPGYGKAITTMHEALESDLLEAHHPFVRHFMDTFDYDDYHIDFPESRRLACLDLVACTKRMITQRDVLLANSEQYVKYIASVFGAVDYTKVICHIDDSSIYLYAVGLLHKGSPFLDGLNKFISRYLESGLKDKDWSDTYFMGRLQSMGSNELFEDTTGEFFVFTINHLSAAFLILILGHIFSCVVFICEVIYRRASK
jgi:hypothetical protein